jgi:UDP-N-acetylglucosamine 2-epimerase
MGGQRKYRVLTVVGARPQFVKAAVIARALRELGDAAPIEELLVHTGQHYDPMLSDVFFRELNIPAPDVNLEVGSDSPVRQIAKILERLEPMIADRKPDAVLVYGDTNSTLAAGLVAAHRNIPLAHVEAGERIFRRFHVPEEINRVVTDHCATLCLTCTTRATSYLNREGMAPERVRFVGDPMYDLFRWASSRLDCFATVTPESYGLADGEYHLATIHRAENTLDANTVISLFEALDGAERPVLLLVHPRVRSILEQSDWSPSGSLRLIDPLGYFDFLRLLRSCRSSITDSGGVSRESFFAGRPCIIPMENSWWPEIVEAGWAQETGDDRQALIEAINTFHPQGERPEALFGDGRAGFHIVNELAAYLDEPRVEPAWHPHGAYTVLPKVRETHFTYTEYRGILQKLRNSGYSFAPFYEAERLLRKNQRFILLRHDIDLDLGKAVALAELENDAGVAATYFFMLRTPHYSLLSREGTVAVERILSLGHHFGLHFDCAVYADKEVETLARHCASEVRIMEQWFQRNISVVSYHRPNALVLTGNPGLSAPLPHTCMPLFVKEITYYSDSRGEWRNGDPTTTEAFEQGRPLHILVHPIWWNHHPTSPYETLQQYADRHKGELELSIARNCKVYRVGRLAQCESI